MTDATANQPWNLYGPRQRWTFLAVLFLVSTSNYVDRHLLSVLLEPIKTEFQVSDTWLGLLTGVAFSLFYATLGIPVARWADRGNRKLIMTVSITLWSVMTAVCGMAQTFWQLALARIGVGVGEAGAIPPAQSLIADYFEPAKRARALAIFMASSVSGYVLAFVFGAWLATTYGWRSAFLVAAVPGLLLVALVHLVLREPRSLPAFQQLPGAQESLSETLQALRSKPSFVRLLIATVIYFLIAYGAVIFFPSYMIRVLDVSLAQIGPAYGAVSAVAAIIGNLVGGFLTDRLAHRNVAWLAWLPAVALLVCLPLYEAMFLMPTFPTFLLFAGLGGLCLHGAGAPMFAALHAVCGPRRRAMAVAIVFFFANLIGLGLGPVIAGAMSDAFSAAHGPVGIRYSLMTVMILLLPCAGFLYACGRRLRADLEP